MTQRPSLRIPTPAMARPAVRASGVANASIYRRADGSVAMDLDFEELQAAAADERGMLWVDLDVSDARQVPILKEIFHFHPLAIEDALNPVSRVKVDEYPSFLVVVARVVGFADQTPDPYDLETANLTVFVTKHVAVTAHTQSSPVVEQLVTRLRANPDLLDRGPSRIAHLALDAAVDAYFPVLDALDEFVDQLERRVFGQFDETMLQEIFKVKRLVISLRRLLSPQREVLSALTMRPSPFLTQEAQLYFRDVYDHMLRITDGLDSFRDLLGSILDGYLTQISNRLGAVSKGLAVVGALSVPFVVIAGVYGMNFDRIPLAHHPYGFEIMLGIQLLLGIGLMLGLRRMRWL